MVEGCGQVVLRLCLTSQQIVGRCQFCIDVEGTVTRFLHRVILLQLKTQVSLAERVGGIVGSLFAERVILIGSGFEVVLLRVGEGKAVTCLLVFADVECTLQTGNGIIGLADTHRLHGVVGQHLKVVLFFLFFSLFGSLFFSTEQGFEKSHIVIGCQMMCVSSRISLW